MSWSFPALPWCLFSNNTFSDLLKYNHHVNTKNKQNQLKSPVHTLFFSVFILCLLLLAAESSPSGDGARMFISLTSNMLGAAGGCSNRSESSCPHWALHCWLWFAPGCPSYRDIKSCSNVMSWFPVCTDKGLSRVGQDANLPWKAVHRENAVLIKVYTIYSLWTQWADGAVISTWSWA